LILPQSLHLPQQPPFPTRRSSDLTRTGTTSRPNAITRAHRVMGNTSRRRPPVGPALVRDQRLRNRISLRGSEPQFKRPRSNDHTDRKSTRLNSSHLGISYAVFCLK